MIKIKIQEFLKSQGVENAYQLQVLLQISPTIATKLWKGEFEKIGINTLNKLCYTFECQPNDLLEYVYDKKEEGYVVDRDRGYIAMLVKFKGRRDELGQNLNEKGFPKR